MFGFGKSRLEKDYCELKENINSLSDHQIRLMGIMVYSLCKEFSDKYESASKWLSSAEDQKYWLSILEEVFAKYLERLADVDEPQTQEELEELEDLGGMSGATLMLFYFEALAQGEKPE